jgi:RNA polymerase sigma-70 factor (ECF subfamily)
LKFSNTGTTCPAPDEMTLVRDCIRKDYKAQKKLFDLYKDAMYTVALRILNDQDEAHDALQESFIQVFRDIQDFRGESTLGAWIKTITVRSALKRLKSLHRIQTGKDTDTPDSKPVVWPAWINSNDLEKAILSLPDAYRVIFLLLEVEGYTHKETALMLDIPVGTSKIRLFRARQLLRKRLTDYGKDYE